MILLLLRRSGQELKRRVTKSLVGNSDFVFLVSLILRLRTMKHKRVADKLSTQIGELSGEVCLVPIWLGSMSPTSTIFMIHKNLKWIRSPATNIR
jgi:hypothetical protein